MSFFGFDASLPRDKKSQQKGIFDQHDPFAGMQQARKLQAFQNEEEEILDFDDTYDGLADNLQETGDDFNDDTFGDSAEGFGAQGAVGKDFDFSGKTAQVSNVIDEEAMRYGLQSRQPQQPISTASKPKRSGYEVYQDPGYIPDIQAKSGFWSSKQQQQQTTSQMPPSSAQYGDGRISTGRPQPTATAPSRRIMSLEEVEAAMRGQGAPQPVPYPQHPAQAQMPLPQHFQHMPPPPHMQPHFDQQPPYPVHPPQAPRPPQQSRSPQPPLQILQNPNRPRQPPPAQQHTRMPSQPPVITHPQQLMELSEEQKIAFLEDDAKRAKRNHKIFQLSKGNGLMTPSDKSFITRIQLQQLVAATGSSGDADPEAALAEDFYYQVYSQIRGAPRQHPTQPLGHFAQTYLFQTGNRHHNRRNQINGDNHMQRMQQQVQRAVEAAKLKPKNKQLIIEGSLGKISFSNAKTPKPLLNIKRQESHDTRPASARKNADVSASDRKTILRNVEAVYTDLMHLEDQERRMPPPPNEEDPASIEAHEEWRTKLAQLNGQLWSDLKIMDPIVPGSAIIHPFIAFLSFSKGKKAIPRIFRQIDSEQRVTILTMIIVHLDQLDVIRNARPASPEEFQPPPKVREEIEQFSLSVMPSLMSYITEAPINIMIGLLQLLIDHTNVVNVSRTKTGLNIMTMLLSRAELVKENGSVSDGDWQQWVSHYNRLFNVLEPILSIIFPGPVNSGDDMYVWQFLAAVGIGASPEQQQRLVIAVKDRVLDTVQQSKALPVEMRGQRLGNVNLFMKAIGLDVEMLG